MLTPRFQDALPEEQMRLSRLLSRYEQYEDAMKLGYETLILLQYLSITI
jgi:hypothetical protein